jgi:hypothetical protein
MSAGDEAEEWLSHCATRAGLTINKAARDRAGWDHIFDLAVPRSPSPTDPLGLPTAVLSGRFQVKETRRRTRRVRIKLSNWRHAIEDPLPWFFVIVCFDAESGEIAEVAAIHLDRDLIEGVMRRLYSIERTRLQRLHRYTYPLTWTDRQLLKPPYHDSLRTLVASTVSDNLHAYAAEKRTWFETVGYSAPPKMTAKFTVRGSTADEILETVSRTVVGLSNATEISDFKTEIERFGVARADPRFPVMQRAEFSTVPTDFDAGFRLSLIDPDGSRILEMPVVFRSSSFVMPDLPDRYRLSRIQGAFVDLVIHDSTRLIEVAFRGPGETQVIVLRDLLLELDFVRALDRRTGRCVDIEITTDEELCFSASLDPPLTLSEAVFELADMVKAIYALARSLDVAQNFRYTLGDIVSSASQVQLMLAARLGERRSISVDFKVRGNAVVPGDEVAVLSDPCVIFEKMAYTELIVIKGRAEVTAADGQTDTIRVLATDVTSIRSYVCTPEQLSQFPFEELTASAEKRLLVEGIKTVFAIRCSALEIALGCNE